MKLNLGSGYKRYEGLINVDQDKNCNPDFLVNLEKDNLPFDNDSVDYVLANHILEHIGEGFLHLMQELYRVCEDGAIIDIEVPHYTHIIFTADPTHKRPITTEGLRLFSQKANRKSIRDGGTSSTLGIMYGVDFEVIYTENVIDPYYQDIVKNNTPEQNEKLGREALNVCICERIKLQVIK